MLYLIAPIQRESPTIYEASDVQESTRLHIVYSPGMHVTGSDVYASMCVLGDVLL